MSLLDIAVLPQGVTVERMGLRFPEGLPAAAFAQIAPVFMAGQRAIQWALGDFVLFGERSYGRTYDELAKLTGYEVQTLTDYAWVARQIEISRRRENVSYSIHKEVAGLPPDQQEWHLNNAEIGSLTVAEVRMSVKLQRDQDAAKNAPAPAPAEVIVEQEKEVSPRQRFATGEPDRPSGKMVDPKVTEITHVSDPINRDVVQQPELRSGAPPYSGGTVHDRMRANPKAESVDKIEAGHRLAVELDEFATQKLLLLAGKFNEKSQTPITIKEYLVALIDREAARLL